MNTSWFTSVDARWYKWGRVVFLRYHVRSNFEGFGSTFAIAGVPNALHEAHAFPIRWFTPSGKSGDNVKLVWGFIEGTSISFYADSNTYYYNKDWYGDCVYIST